MGMGLRTSGWLFLVFLFPLKSENNTEIYAQACKCDWTSCNTPEMQQVRPITDNEPTWTKQHLALKKKKSILFVLPDILMFNMRVLYYHDDYDYSCAILVYCCLNVTLFFYDMMRWKLGLEIEGHPLKKIWNIWSYCTQRVNVAGGSLTLVRSTLHHFSWGSTLI